MKDRIVPVFEGVWVDVEDCAFLKDCSICGPGCDRLVDFPPCSLTEYDYDLLLAKEIAAAAAARNDGEFLELSEALLRPEALLERPPGRWYGHVAGWLVRTMGRTRAEVLAFLERVARCGFAPGGYESRVPVYLAPGTGAGAAKAFAYPAILALSDSCAEFNILVRAAYDLGVRLWRRVKPLCYRRGMSARDVAVIYARQILRILKNRHRYVL